MSSFIFKLNDLSYSDSNGFLNRINLNIKHNEIHAIIANSNSQQNTLIKSLITFDKSIRTGKILFKSNLIQNNLFYNDKVAIMHRSPLLINNMSVAENITLLNLPRKRVFRFINWKKSHIKSQKTLDKLGFDLNASVKVNSLSDEDKRLVYIAKIFNQNPELIIMQEPTEGLSPLNVTKLIEIIQQYKSKGGSVLYITKNWEETLKIADRISILSKGRIIDEISAKAAILDPQRLLGKLDAYSLSETNLKDNNSQQVLDAIFNAAEFLSSEYELKDVLLLIAKEVTDIMNADGCSIKLIDETTRSIIDDFDYKRENNFSVELSKQAIIKISKESSIFYVNRNDSEFNALFKYNENIKTLICIPVLIRKQVTGIIQIFYKDLYVYSKDEATYLSTLARHAALAIEDTRLMGRSALLQESHHRIKNNLQSIVGLISLQKLNIQRNPDIPINDVFDNIISSVKSIASIHNLLSKDKLGRSIINVREIIDEIISLNDIDDNITINSNLEDILMPYNKATSVALIINELINNSYKHAFSHQIKGTIKVLCKRIDDYVFISIMDDGLGLPKSFNIEHTNSLGLSIIQGIIQSDFNGELCLYNNHGTTAEVKILDKYIF